MIRLNVDDVKDDLKADPTAGLAALLVGQKGCGFGGAAFHEVSEKMSCVFVQIAPGDQPLLPHFHSEREEMYFITKGIGEMLVGEELERVKSGDLIFVPAKKKHGIRNPDNEVLEMVIFTAPAFNIEDRISITPEWLRERWDLDRFVKDVHH